MCVSGFKRSVHSKIVYCVILVCRRSGNFAIKKFLPVVLGGKNCLCAHLFTPLGHAMKIKHTNISCVKKKLHKISRSKENVKMWACVQRRVIWTVKHHEDVWLLIESFNVTSSPLRLQRKMKNSHHVGVQDRRSFCGDLHERSDILTILLIRVESDKIPLLHKLKQLYKRLPVGFSIAIAYLLMAILYKLYTKMASSFLVCGLWSCDENALLMKADVKR